MSEQNNSSSISQDVPQDEKSPWQETATAIIRRAMLPVPERMNKVRQQLAALPDQGPLRSETTACDALYTFRDDLAKFMATPESFKGGILTLRNSLAAILRDQEPSRWDTEASISAKGSLRKVLSSLNGMDTSLDEQLGFLKSDLDRLFVDVPFELSIMIKSSIDCSNLECEKIAQDCLDENNCFNTVICDCITQWRQKHASRIAR